MLLEVQYLPFINMMIHLPWWSHRTPPIPPFWSCPVKEPSTFNFIHYLIYIIFFPCTHAVVCNTTFMNSIEYLSISLKVKLTNFLFVKMRLFLFFQRWQQEKLKNIYQGILMKIQVFWDAFRSSQTLTKLQSLIMSEMELGRKRESWVQNSCVNWHENSMCWTVSGL